MTAMPIHTVTPEKVKSNATAPEDGTEIIEPLLRFTGALFATRLTAVEHLKIETGNEHRHGRLVAVFSVQAVSVEAAEEMVLAKHWEPKKNLIDFKGLRPHFRHDFKSGPQDGTKLARYTSPAEIPV